jgi:thiamine-phosphate pyrophosphorylase
MYNRLQYISDGNTVEEQTQNIQKALQNGCKWIQLRFKKSTPEELFTLAKTVKELCTNYSATFMINDNVQLAKNIDADGVHLGLTDMKVDHARAILGNSKIIGGTANTLKDVLQRVEEKCDYIGLGPFQFTSTKANLSPILGLEGYHNIIEKLISKHIEMPIYAIGGITLENIEPLRQTGIYGIALSGLINKSEKPGELINQLNEKLHDNI